MLVVLAVSCPLYALSQDFGQEKCTELAEESGEKEIEPKENKTELFNSKANVFGVLAINQQFVLANESNQETIWQKVITPPPEN
ncbi:MAG: hypothetical protein JXR19_05410 [Bacteroidia bacterium]